MKKKGIVLVASINSFHGNLLPGRFEQLYEEELGLEAIGLGGLKMTINCHGIDFLMYPWLAKYFKKFDNFQLASGLFSHVMPTLFSDNYVSFQQEVGDSMIASKIPVCFYPEFCNPEKPKNNFWILNSQNHYYSLEEDSFFVSWKDDSLISEDSIEYDGQIGLVMKEEKYKPILSSLFLAQRLPDEIRSDGLSNLDYLVKQIKEVDDLILIPFDLESPYIGSFLGKEFWIRFISKLEESNLGDMFLDFFDVFDDLKKKAKHVDDAPHRSLAKWTNLPATFSYYSKINSISQRNLSLKEKILLAIAGNGDLAAAIYQKSFARKVLLPAVKMDNTLGEIEISGSQDVIDVSYLALRSLENGGDFLSNLFYLKNKNLFIRRLIQVFQGLSL
jgi:hypothetical protein